MKNSFINYVLIALALVLASCGDSDSSVNASEGTIGFLTDSRDGQTYKTVVIGKRIWMTENLNYEIPNSYCYNDKVFNCTKYGRLYT